MWKVDFKYGCRQNMDVDFIKWIETLLECQESCIINGGITTKYLKLQKGARQGDPISAYLFILCLKIVFILIKAWTYN